MMQQQHEATLRVRALQELGLVADVAMMEAALVVLCEHGLTVHCFQFAVEMDRRVVLRSDPACCLSRIVCASDGLIVAEGAENGMHTMVVCRALGGASWDSFFRNEIAITWCKYGFPVGTEAVAAAPSASMRAPLWLYGPQGLWYVVLEVLHASHACVSPHAPKMLVQDRAVDAVKPIPGTPWLVALSSLEDCALWQVYDVVDCAMVCEIAQPHPAGSEEEEQLFRELENLFVVTPNSNVKAVSGVNCLNAGLPRPGLVCALARKYRSALVLDALLLADGDDGSNFTWAVARFDTLPKMQRVLEPPDRDGDVVYACTDDAFFQIELQNTLVTTETPLALPTDTGADLKLLSLQDKVLLFVEVDASRQYVTLGTLET